MLKIRITFIDDKEGQKELGETIKDLSKTHIIINQSQVYKGRGKSLYSNVYLDIKNK